MGQEFPELNPNQSISNVYTDDSNVYENSTQLDLREDYKFIQNLIGPNDDQISNFTDKTMSSLNQPKLPIFNNFQFSTNLNPTHPKCFSNDNFDLERHMVLEK